MIHVAFPEANFKLKKEGDKQLVFCQIRKQWLQLTEEEWVRQCFVQYLIEVLHFPAPVIALEKELLLNGLKKRFDILVYNNDFKPWMLIECKAPEVVLNETVLQQVLRYNMSIPVRFIVITNGKTTVGWEKKNNLEMLDKLPNWE